MLNNVYQFPTREVALRTAASREHIHSQIPTKQETVQAAERRKARHTATIKLRRMPGAENSAEVMAFLKAIYHTAEKNAAARKIPFEISLDHIVELCNRSGWRCAVTGTPFSLAKDHKWVRRPFVPSIDRRDSTRGYTRDNVRLVCSMASLAMNEWGERVFRNMVDCYLAKRSRPADIFLEQMG